MNKKLAQSLIEYGLILALVAVVAIAALQLLGKKINTAAEKSGTNIENAASNASKTYCEESVKGTWNEETGICTPP